MVGVVAKPKCPRRCGESAGDDFDGISSLAAPLTLTHFMQSHAEGRLYLGGHGAAESQEIRPRNIHLRSLPAQSEVYNYP